MTDRDEQHPEPEDGPLPGPAPDASDATHADMGLDAGTGADVGWRSPLPGDGLVERLAGADPETEPPVEHLRRRRRGVGDDGRMGPHGRAGHPGGHFQGAHGRGDAAEDGPDERAVACERRPDSQLAVTAPDSQPGANGTGIIRLYGG